MSTFTLARELGHTGVHLVERIYGHLGEVRHRSEVVEFRVEQHFEHLVPLLNDTVGELISISLGAVFRFNTPSILRIPSGNSRAERPVKHGNLG